MIHFKPGSQAYNIIALLSVTGEFPLASIGILGSRQTYENTVRRMLTPQRIADVEGDITCKLLNVSGMNGRRKIRLTKDALPLLELMGAKEYYCENFMKSNPSSNSKHATRSARFAESVAMFLAAGYEFRPYKLPTLQRNERKLIVGREPLFYPAKIIKTFDNSDVKKTGFTRMTGALLARNRAYVVYNTQDEIMKGFDNGGEIKADITVSQIAAFNAGGNSFSHNPAIMFGTSDEIVATMLKTYDKLYEKYKSVRKRGTTYENVHFFTLDANGVRQLRLMKYPDLEQEIIEGTFKEEELIHGYIYKAYRNGIYWFSFLSTDIALLQRYRRVVKEAPEQYGVICFEHQRDLIRECFGEKVKVGTITLDAVEQGLSE